MALAGDHIVVKLDDSGGTLRTFDNGDISSVELGLTNDQHEATGFGDAAHNFVNGQLQAPVTINGFLTTTATTGTHTIFAGLLNAASPVAVSLVVQIGDNTDPTTGDPEYTGEFYLQSYTPTIETGGAVTFAAVLQPATGTAPAWGTVS